MPPMVFIILSIFISSMELVEKNCSVRRRNERFFVATNDRLLERIFLPSVVIRSSIILLIAISYF